MRRLDISDFEVAPENVERELAARSELGRRRRRARAADLGEPFTRVPLRYLLNRRYWQILPPRARMLLWIVFRTQNGERATLLTTEEAEMLGVAHNKIRDVQKLEAAGLIAITRNGTATVSIKLVTENEGRMAREASVVDRWLSSF
jgi:hypothetical protein